MVNNYGDGKSVKDRVVLFPFQMAGLYGLWMGVILTILTKWDDPPSGGPKNGLNLPEEGIGPSNSHEKSLMSEVRSPGRLRSRTSEKGGELVYLEDDPT